MRSVRRITAQFDNRICNFTQRELGANPTKRTRSHLAPLAPARPRTPARSPPQTACPDFGSQTPLRTHAQFPFHRLRTCFNIDFNDKPAFQFELSQKSLGGERVELYQTKRRLHEASFQLNRLYGPICVAICISKRVSRTMNKHPFLAFGLSCTSQNGLVIKRVSHFMTPTFPVCLTHDSSNGACHKVGMFLEKNINTSSSKNIPTL